MKGMTLARLRNTSFANLYEKLALGQTMKKTELKKLLSIAVIFINDSNQDISRLGYRIIVFYCNLTKDYKPLYDVSLNSGLIPVAKSIENFEQYKGDFESSFFNIFNSSFGENYKNNDLYMSNQQKELSLFFEQMENESVSVVAPTSYGKSELIISTLVKSGDGNTCILVPTKALLAQTKRRLINGKVGNVTKLITHPEMYLGNEKNITAILTQERLLRLLQKHQNLIFDVVFVDEAHNLLENNNRNILLASAISILEKRNPNVVFKFLTPFLVDSSNLNVEYSKYNLKTFHITEYIKTERFYLYDFENEKKLKFYDQFLDRFFNDNKKSYRTDIELINDRKGIKNIIYLNKPTDIEKFSYKLSLTMRSVYSDKIKKACEELSNYLHADYFLINCIKKGFIYHHGCVPDNIRIYIENLYSKEKELEFVVTSSTLLEGVNLPAEKLFLLDNKKGRSNLTPSQFKNLIGRICRFSEVFSPRKINLNNLEPQIYLIKSTYISSKANIDKYIKSCMKADKIVKDSPTNVLLKNVEINEGNNHEKDIADEFIENFEPGIVTNYDKSYATTEIGRLCFTNSVNEIDIILNEKNMQNIIDQNMNIKIKTTKELFGLFSKVVLPFLKEEDNHNNLKRLLYTEARNFYQMFLDWRIKNASYSEMINSFLLYWTKLENEGRDTFVFVGRWGEETRDGYLPLWIDIKNKDKKQRINLAIVRIKEEQDFLDNTFIKFIEVFNELGVLEEDFYERIKYGTSDKTKIILIKNGLSSGLVNLLVNNYSDYINVDFHESEIKIKPSIIGKMRNDGESDIFIYELEYNTHLF